jgi:predicted signal transduction protein with EAL and GGDEF domain
MADRPDTQARKLSLMEGPEERVQARAFWDAQRAYQETEQTMERYYQPLVERCKTKTEAFIILERIPDSVSRAFLRDYVEFGRDWSRPHPKVAR